MKVSRLAEMTLALIPITLVSGVVFPLAMAAAMGVGFALLEHARAGEPYWVTDAIQVGVFVGSVIGGTLGVGGLWAAVLRPADLLARDTIHWRTTVVALVAGMTTAAAWLASGYWPWTSLWLTYPVVAASTVATYRLVLLVIARVRSS